MAITRSASKRADSQAPGSHPGSSNIKREDDGNLVSSIRYWWGFITIYMYSIHKERFSKRKEQRQQIAALRKQIAEASAAKQRLIERNRDLRYRLKEVTECLQDAVKTVEAMRNSLLKTGNYSEELHERMMEELKDINVYKSDDSDCNSVGSYDGA
ncbi:hypothetical protein CC1G_04459 [Coprinopsis cinerea okayama7|uniref:Uncharacterized protein n=1 Tax=Coprinopsis cinerea (strain Okayama-7 / 130 / ATCC MYA-4618 / FGSC 9003) TaxID=240176 RepID=A8N577_COPC7|nr:hypothetical protein CC1G_04459 [Coprinopsis cinerea okayama7\|eukprot:XP_001830026.2 hypothetical protein CC1G_04459 [Coprinopsis cinerea okayama7\